MIRILCDTKYYKSWLPSGYSMIFGLDSNVRSVSSAYQLKLYHLTYFAKKSYSNFQVRCGMFRKSLTTSVWSFCWLGARSVATHATYSRSWPITRWHLAHTASPAYAVPFRRKKSTSRGIFLEEIDPAKRCPPFRSSEIAAPFNTGYLIPLHV